MVTYKIVEKQTSQTKNILEKRVKFQHQITDTLLRSKGYIHIHKIVPCQNIDKANKATEVIE